MDITSELFANFFLMANPLITKKIRSDKPIKTLHLTMKKHDICENRFCETFKSCEINALGFKETSDLCQTTSSKSDI